MIKEHRRAFKLMRMAVDLSLVSATYYAIYLALRLGVNPLGLNLDYHPDYHWRVPAFIALCWVFSFVSSGAYNQSTRAIAPSSAILIAAKMLGIMLAVFVMGLFAFKIQFLSRKFMGAYSLSCLGLLTLTKALEFKALGWLRGMGFNTLSVVLVGERA